MAFKRIKELNDKQISAQLKRIDLLLKEKFIFYQYNQ